MHDGKILVHTGSRLTHDDAARVKFKGVIGDSQKHHGTLHLQGVQVRRQWVLGTHSIDDAIQSGSNTLQSSKSTTCGNPSLMEAVQVA